MGNKSTQDSYQNMSSTAFDSLAAKYDQWYDTPSFAYLSEIKAIRRFIPSKGFGVEIGVGTGRFSLPFSITVGVDPSKAMAKVRSWSLVPSKIQR